MRSKGHQVDCQVVQKRPIGAGGEKRTVCEVIEIRLYRQLVTLALRPPYACKSQQRSPDIYSVKNRRQRFKESLRLKAPGVYWYLDYKTYTELIVGIVGVS